jgi:hypothetical protein
MGVITSAAPARQPLTDLAEQICAEHRAAVVAVAKGLDHAMAAGDLLIKVRKSEQLKHGEWEFWVKQNCGFAIETARLYIRLADNRAAIEANRQRVIGLSVRAAAKLISGPSRPQNSRASAVLAPAPKAEQQAPKKGRITHCDVFKLWDQLPAEGRQRFFDMIGLDGILNNIPDHWGRVVQQKLSEMRDTVPVGNQRGVRQGALNFRNINTERG